MTASLRRLPYVLAWMGIACLGVGFFLPPEERKRSWAEMESVFAVRDARNVLGTAGLSLAAIGAGWLVMRGFVEGLRNRPHVR